MSTPIIAPSILSADLAQFGNDVNEVVQAGADWLHIDVMDGSFVPAITFGANIVATCKSLCSLPLDVHLMINNPDAHITAFKDAGASVLTVHQEACLHLHRTLGEIRKSGMKSGVAINPGTPAETLFPILELTDLVLVMTVNPGWGGQSFIQSCLQKITLVKEEAARQSLNLHVQVDGGVNESTGKLCVAAGADVLVAGSYIFGSSNRKQALDSLR